MEDIRDNTSNSKKTAHSLQLTADRQIPYGRQQITQEDIDAVIQTLTSDFLTQGPKVKEFESLFAKYVDAQYAVAVNNATAGLHLSAKVLGTSSKTRVITTPLTFVSSANCVRMCGGEVWFADIDPETYLIDFNSVKKLIEEHPKGFFHGLILVDFAGLPVNTEIFKKLADEHDLWIIEDACHAPGGYYKDSKGETIKCGSGTYVDLAVFSFHPVKHIACGEGGMITTNKPSLAQELAKAKTHGIVKQNLKNSHGGWYYEMQSLGYNYRFTEFQSALGISQLAKNPEGVKRRQEIAEKYQQAFEGKITFQNVPSGFYHAYHLFVIEVNQRKELYDYLREHKIFAQIHYIPVHLHPYYKKIGYKGADLQHAENYYNSCLSLPMFPSLTDEEQDYVIEKVLKFYNL